MLGARHCRQRTTALVALALATTAPCAGAADASPCQPRDGLSTCLPADNLWPYAGHRWLSQAPSELGPAGSLGFGLASSYLLRPIGLRLASPDPDGTTVYAVEHALDATVLLSLGLAKRLAVDLAAPVTLLQLGAGKADVVGSDDALPRSAVGDLRFGATVGLLTRAPGADGLALTARAHVATPTGSKDAFASSPSVTFAPGTALGYRYGRFELGVDAGARIRRWAQLAGAIVGNQLSLSLAASYDVLGDRWLGVSAQAWSLFTLEQQTEWVSDPGALRARERPSSDPHIPAEWLLTVRCAHFMQGHLSLETGAGTAIPTGPVSEVTSPALRVVAAVGYRP